MSPPEHSLRGYAGLVPGPVSLSEGSTESGLMPAVARWYATCTETQIGRVAVDELDR